MNGKLKIKTAITSTASLFAGWIALQLIERSILLIGSYLSGFRHATYWTISGFVPTPGPYSTEQALFLFLVPASFFFILFLLFPSGNHPEKKKSKFVLLFRSWFFLLLMIKALFLPITEILEKHGVYVAFSQLGFSWSAQIALGFFLTGLLIYHITRVAALFSYALETTEKQFLTPQQILPQLVFLWFIPIVVVAIVLLITNFHPGLQDKYAFAGFVGILLINIPIIGSYQVVAK